MCVPKLIYTVPDLRSLEASLVAKLPVRMRHLSTSHPPHLDVDMGETVFSHGNYTVRHWTPKDRQKVCEVVRECLAAYGLEFEPQGADRDAIAVEDHYLREGRGEFWVVVDNVSKRIVGSGGYYKQNHEFEQEGSAAAEIRKMYLLPEARGKKLGWALLEVCAETVFFHNNF